MILKRLALVLWCWACGATPGNDDEPVRLHAVVRRLHVEPVRFATPATARPCRTGGPGILVEGADRGNGVLVLLRDRHSLAPGDYTLLVPGDSVTPRGALVSARYMTADIAHGFRLDSGSVQLRAVAPLSIRVAGSGTELPAAQTSLLEADFSALPVGTDSVSCRVQP